MKLTVYLLRDSITDLGQLTPEGFKPLPPEKNLSFPCQAWVQANRSKKPGWTEWLSSAFDIESLELMNQSNSFVLFLKMDGRVFAVSFGYGFNAIDRSMIEPDFGLKVTLNKVDPDALDMLDTRTVDRVSRQRRTHLNTGRPVNDFDISLDADWIRMVSGKPLSEDFARKLAGSDSLRISMDCALEDLGERCRTLLQTYGKKDYKKHFAFIDHLRPLKAKDPLLGALRADLILLLQARDTERIAIAFPEPPSQGFTEWKIWHGHKSERYDDLDLSRVYDFLAKHPDVTVDPDKIHVLGMDEDGNPLMQRDCLHSFLVAQVDLKDATYILSLGQWFRAEKGYVKAIRERVRQLHDVTGTLNLPQWMLNEREGEYSLRVGVEKTWLVQDCKMIHIERRDKVEPCDLLSPQGDFVHIKDMKDSATLSHLFSQGSVSATLFKLEPAYHDELKARYQKFYGSQADLDGQGKPRVVYAIATSRKGELADTLFFFSLVNLLQHIDQVRLAGFDVALCKIEREAA